LQSEKTLKTDYGIHVVKVVEGAIARYRFKKKKKAMEKYFSGDEGRSTLESGEIFNSSQPIKSRQHVYPSGATYSGSWLGGMRHGTGKMTWKDGSHFSGLWSYN